MEDKIKNKKESPIDIYFKHQRKIENKLRFYAKKTPLWIRFILFFKKEKFMIEETNELIIVFNGKKLLGHSYFIRGYWFSVKDR